MRKAAIVSIFAALASLLSPSLHGQESFHLDARHSLGFSSTFSGDSSHILIGDSEQRKVWTLGADYSLFLLQTPHLRLDYVGSIMPLYEETDPYVNGTTFQLNGQDVTSTTAPTRVIYAIRGPIGTVATGKGQTSPLYALTGREDTYAAAFTPLGARVSAFPRRRIQPTFAIDLGFVLSARDIPIEQSSQFNFLFSFGPGVQLFTSPSIALRLEYLYSHMSNASLGNQNPGVDQGVARVTLSHRW